MIYGNPLRRDFCAISHATSISDPKVVLGYHFGVENRFWKASALAPGYFEGALKCQLTS